MSVYCSKDQADDHGDWPVQKLRLWPVIPINPVTCCCSDTLMLCPCVVAGYRTQSLSLPYAFLRQYYHSTYTVRIVHCAHFRQ